MNIFHGIIAGYYLTYLALWGSKRNTGKIFGFGYAFGSIGTFLLSLLFNGSIGHGFIFVIYGFLAVIAIVIHEVSPKYISDENFQEPFDSAKYSRKQLILAIIIVFLLSFVKNIGFYFPTNDFITGSVSPVMTRCFYAVGLIIAGIINDRSRRYGSICCVCALVFPFWVLTLENYSFAASITWIIGYFFFGFFAVYRVVIFSDIAKTESSALYLAGFGLLFGRIGDLTSSLLGIALSSNTVLLISSATVLFVATEFIFTLFYNENYVTVIQENKNQEDIFHNFIEAHGISQRESEVLINLLMGLSNPEISEKLYISENTVKFHMRNILKKTGCTKRSEVISLYREYQNNNK